MNNKLKFLGIIVAMGLLAVVMAWLAGYFEGKVSPGSVTIQPATISGKTYTVGVAEEPVVEQATGTVRSRHETVLSSRITAAVVAVPVRAGDSVSPGDVLVSLDDRELVARLEQRQQAVAVAEANLAEAESSFARISSLRDRKAVSEAEFDRAEAEVRSARAELVRAGRAVEEAETALSYSRIRSTVSARVVDRLVDPGDTAIPGQPLLRLYDPDQLRLEANVRESLASALQRGQSLVARIDALAAEYPVVVEEIVPSADPGSRSFLVKVKLPGDAELFPGMFGRLLIEHGTTRRYYIPERALTRVGQLEFVMVVGDGGAVRRFVRTGNRGSDDLIEVISGLMPGERVLISPQ